MQNETKEREYSTFQYFIFVFLIPLIFTLTAAFVILKVAGVDMSKETKKIASHIPYVNSLVKEDSSLSEKEQLKNKVVKLSEANKETQQELSRLKSQSDEKDQRITNLRIEAEKLRQQIKDQQEQNNSNIDSIAEKKSLSKKLFSSYEEMQPKHAAQIISNLSDEEAFYILSNINKEAVTNILSNMEVGKAAKFTSMMTAKSR